jgi:hypothetical protein
VLAGIKRQQLSEASWLSRGDLVRLIFFRYVSFNQKPANGTMVSGCFKLEAGTALDLGAGSVEWHANKKKLANRVVDNLIMMALI